MKCRRSKVAFILIGLLLSLSMPTYANEIGEMETSSLTSVPIEVKVGLQNPPTGCLVIKENEKGMFQKGELTISVLDDRGRAIPGISFEGDGRENLKLQVIGDLKAELETSLDKTNSLGEITINIKRRSSKEAAVLVLSDFTLTVDRMVPYGTYDLKIYGSSLDNYANVSDNYILVKDFIKITTPDTETLELQRNNVLNEFLKTFLRLPVM